jgi:hypothetical protein
MTTSHESLRLGKTIMPSNTTILLIRHAERPKSGLGLAPAGQARAQAYIAYFQNYLLNGQPINFDFIFAAADSPDSQRPRLTVTPIADALQLNINATFAETNYTGLRDYLFQDTQFNDCNILICWHHSTILQLATALGVKRKQLPPQSNWPSKWHGKVFGWLLQISYDSQGNIMPTQTFCLNQQLMYDDYGQNPPAV